VRQFLIVCDRPLLRKSFAAVTSRYGFIRPTLRQHSSWPWADVLKFDGQISIVRRLLSVVLPRNRISSAISAFFKHASALN